MDVRTPPAPTSADDVGLPSQPPQMVPADVRTFVRDHALARPDPRAAAFRIAGSIVLWAAAGAVGLLVNRWWAWVAVWMVLALLLAGSNSIMHESVHHNLFRSRTANHVVGSISGVFMLLPGPGYRAYHLTHHAYTYTPQDSEKLPQRFRTKLHYLGFALALGPAFAVLLWAGVVAAMVGKPPSWMGTARIRSHVRRWSLLSLLTVAALGVWAALAPRAFLMLWLVPALLASMLVFPFFTLPEHLGGQAEHGLFGNTRTVVSGRIGRLVWWNNNFHTAHHLVPSVPPSRLPVLDAQIAERNTLRERTFFRFHAGVLRSIS